MARPTVTQLAAQVLELQAEVAELRATVAELSTPAVQYVRELTAPAPISTPIDFQQMAVDLGASQAYADPYDEWGPATYL